MATTYLSPVGNEQQSDANGAPLNGGKILTYQAGTTTQTATYTDSAGSAAQANPIILNASGLPANPIWLPAGQAVKLVIQDAAGATLRTVDNVTGINDPASTTALSEWVAFAGAANFVSATSFSVSGDQRNTFQAGRRVRLQVTAGTVYASIASSVYTTVTTVTIQADAGTALDSGLSSVATGLMAAQSSSLPGPLAGVATGSTALSFRNRARNGKMDIAQRGASFAALASGAYGLDGWKRIGAGAQVVTHAQAADSDAASEFGNVLRVTVTTANASPAAGDHEAVSQPIEGYLVRDLVGNPVAIRFKVKSPKAGTHCVSVINSGSDRSYVLTYNVAAANTPQTVTLALPGGLITAGTWNFTTGIGVQLRFALMAGSNFQTTAGAWQSGNFLATSAQVNCADTVNAVFEVTGVQMERANVSTPFEHRDYALDLALCQRYARQRSFYIFGVAGSANQVIAQFITNDTPMRATPTLSIIGSPTYTNGSGLTVDNARPDGFRAYYTATAAGSSAVDGVVLESADL